MAFSSPQYSPRHSRRDSLISQAGSAASSHVLDRRASKSSIRSQSTPLRSSFGQQDRMMLDASLFGGTGGGGNNLADELADAFDNEDFEYDDDEQEVVAEEGDGGPQTEGGGGVPDLTLDKIEGSRVDASPALRSHGRTTSTAAGPGETLSPPERRGHRRKGSDYDGSEYGSETDLDCPGMPPGLIAKIDAVDSLARRGMETNGGSTDRVFERVAEALRDLGSQSGVEGNATRLITAHSALTTHLVHQARQLQNLALPILSPLTPAPASDDVDSILSILLSLSDTMPRPSTSAFSSLAALHSLTTDLIQTLSYLADSLHMSRQITTAAMRRLKTAKELVAEMRRDEQLSEDGKEWLERGNWSERLEKRECASVCGDVVGGFEEVCNGWRARLFEHVEEAPA